MAQIREKEIFLNPYVIQMDKFADSLKKLSEFAGKIIAVTESALQRNLGYGAVCV